MPLAVSDFYENYSQNMQKLEKYVIDRDAEDEERTRAITDLFRQVDALRQSQDNPAQTRHRLESLSSELTAISLKVHEVKL